MARRQRRVQRRLFATVAALLAASLIAWAASLAAASPAVPAAKSNANVVGRQLYRTYCGQCHALAQALSAGFGSNTKGIGANGGPSFNELRVLYAQSVTAVTEPTGGHENVRTKIKPTQLKEVAAYIARITIHNPIQAFSTDG